MRRNALALLAVSLVACGTAAAAEHPFILWNREDVALLKERMESEKWARTALERLRGGRSRPVAELFRAAVLNEEDAVREQKKKLMEVARSPAPRGAAQWLTVLRYDLLYDELTGEQRRRVERFFRTYIENHVFRREIFNPDVFNDSRNYSRYDAVDYTRSNWLPNIIWPWKVSANLMAVALRDEELIRRTWAAYGSWQWYFDRYLGDVGFYEEEFSKMGSTPGAMILYCRGLRRLGLNELGYGYEGRGGATMRGHIGSLLQVGYPRTDLCSARPRYPMVTMGDLRQSGSSAADELPTPAFQHSIVEGFLPDGTGGNTRWRAHGAWGGETRGDHAQWDGYTGFTPKMQIPLWFEAAHARWPEAGFDYFLAAMRPPGRRRYLPSPLFGLSPIDPAETDPPPAPSGVWPERGLVMLRAREGPDYWESDAPAVCMRLASNYAHRVRDSFALLGFHAFNRPIYVNRQVTPGYATGWSRSIESHCGVKVDDAEPGFTRSTAVRSAFAESVKFVSAFSGTVYPDEPGADLSRTQFLTDDYLLDLTRLTSGSEHDYRWFVHAPGVEQLDDRWRPADFPGDLHPLEDARARSTDGPWSVRIVQECALEDPSQTALPREWYDRKVGVRLHVLGADGTTARVARTPLPREEYAGEDGEERQRPVPTEMGGRTILASRRAKRTTFAALHEPFERGRTVIRSFRRIDRTSRGLAVSVRGRSGSGIDDRLMVRFGNARTGPITLSGGGEVFTFDEWAHVRVAEGTVEVSGQMRAMKLRGEGSPGLVVNGRPKGAEISNGYLRWGDVPAGQ